MRLWLIFAAAVAWGQDSVQVTTRAVDRHLIEQRLEKVKTKAADRRVTLEAEFRDAGCNQIDSLKVPRSPLPDLICVLPAAAAHTILVGAHFDLAELGTGAVDDWSGASLLPSLYQSLAGEPRRHRFVFVGFAAEERGLWGSKAYVKEMTAEARAGLSAMVNIDCVGMAPTTIWGNRSDPVLTAAYVKVARSLGLSPASMNVDRVGDDDSHPFFNAKIPVASFHSLTQQNFRILHSVRDNLTAIDRQQYYDAYRLISLYLAYLDATLD
jgi:hypothetical protein